MAEALRRVGASVQCTELPGVGHNAWDPACERADLIDWMFKQRRQSGRRMQAHTSMKRRLSTGAPVAGCRGGAGGGVMRNRETRILETVESASV